MNWVMPASLAPGTSVSPSASSVAAWSAFSVRSGTPSACACRGVSMISTPPTVKASAPSPAPCTKARRSMPVMMFPPSPRGASYRAGRVAAFGEIQRSNGERIKRHVRKFHRVRHPTGAPLSLFANSIAYRQSVRLAAKKPRCFQSISHKISRKPAPLRDRSVTWNRRPRAAMTSPSPATAAATLRSNPGSSLSRCRTSALHLIAVGDSLRISDTWRAVAICPRYPHI